MGPQETVVTLAHTCSASLRLGQLSVGLYQARDGMSPARITVLPEELALAHPLRPAPQHLPR